jgi:hypothetical protein
MFTGIMEIFALIAHLVSTSCWSLADRAKEPRD